jgi:hypothetical protein
MHGEGVKTDPVDCALRCYRVIEIAVQIVVFKFGINPWQPVWSKLGEDNITGYLNKLRSQNLPGNMSLDSRGRVGNLAIVA